ncbi:hypothetical protein AB0P12_11670 [Streptomyces subrutilus]|uniref:hypothetical protein n=1 Tax=Streptomyces subrutilus TaxID=36818 RepID=UPI0033CF9282
MAARSRIEPHHVAVPPPTPFRPARIPGRPRTHNRFDPIRLLTDDGVAGRSAGPAMARERAGLGDLLGPYLPGLDPADIPTVRQRLPERACQGRHNARIAPASTPTRAGG